MEIILKRIAKKGTYTIGRLYLFDGSANNSVNSYAAKQDTADCKSAEMSEQASGQVAPQTAQVIKRELLPGKHSGDKRIVRYEVDPSQLTKARYFCDTLEPTWRNLLGIPLAPQEVDARHSRVSGKRAHKVKGKTAIPEGSYPVVITKSPRFKQWLPLLQGVPDFEGIRIHAGNYPDDTEGCILVGENKQQGMVVNSRIWLRELIKRITEARERDEAIWITII